MWFLYTVFFFFKQKTAYEMRISDWSSDVCSSDLLGDTAVAVWTRPSEAWLLELSGPCPDIEYAPMIGVTSQFNRVSAKFDKVIAQGGGATMRFPCRIETIRPPDVKAIKQAEKIGRASCRDRVGQYMEDMVVVDPLKKTQ